MLTDQSIKDLIEIPKVINSRTPAAGYREESGHRRCNLALEEQGDTGSQFSVFIRLHNRFIENFTIGLRYHTGDPNLRTITLARYNGSHGESSLSRDGHYAKPHIHRITQAEIASGSTQPQESHRELTDRYRTYAEGLRVFFEDIAAVDYLTYFPELRQLRLLQ